MCGRAWTFDDHGPVIYEAAGGHYLFAAAVEQYVKRIDFAQRGYAERLYPAGRQSPVVIDPEFAFGAPSVDGIRTAVLTELLDAGEGSHSSPREYADTRHSYQATGWRPP